tara:strand:+ start:15334 stop:17409 length:2076 start_codon:yes stop_codon:yes gene_type:complete
MAVFNTLQQRFTQGEIDPLMVGRSDIDQYYGAVSTAKNVITIPQGGFRRFPGLEYIDRVLGGSLTKIASTSTTPDTGSIGTTDMYVSHQEDAGGSVSMGVLYLAGASISTGTSSEFYLQVSSDNVSWITVGAALTLTQTAKDYTRRVHGNYRYARLVRIGTTDLGSATVTITSLEVATESGLSKTRTFSYSFNIDQTYKMVVSDKNIAIYQGTVYLIDIYVSNLIESRLKKIDYEFDADTLIIFHEDIPTIRLQRNGANDIWTLSTVAYTNIPQFNFGLGNEPVWSATRGYPRHGRFYQGRLWIDGGKSRPSIVYGSKVNDFFNFDFGTSLADEAIGPLSQSFDDVTAIYPGRNLMIFTVSAEYIVPQTFGDAITPESAVLTRQSSIGSEPCFRPQEVEGAVMYIQRQGASVQEFIFDDTQQAFNNNYVSLLSSHLIKDPIDFSLRKATSTEEGAYLLLVREDGGLTVANILRSQGITSFVNRETQGDFMSCAVDENDMFFVIKRTINGSEVQYVERFNEEHLFDASTRLTSGLPISTLDDLSYLENTELSVMIDGAVQPNTTVSNGSIALARQAYTSVEVGLNFIPKVTDLPVELLLENGASLQGRKVNLSEVSLRLSETTTIEVNDKTVIFQKFGLAGIDSPLDAEPTRFTGVRRIKGFLGWTEDGQVTITQTIPGYMTVLSIKKMLRT